MRYAQKMVCLLVLVLAASFGIGGCVLLYSDFAVQRSRAAVSASRASSAGGRVRCSVSMAPSGVSRLRQPMKISSIYTEE